MEATAKSEGRLDRGFVEDWAQRYLEAWNAHDADGVASLCTEDIVWNDPGLPSPARGREGVRDFVRATKRAFPDFHVEELAPIAISEGGLAFSQYRMTGTMRGRWTPFDLAPTGARISVLGVDEWTFRGEQMSHYRTYYDSLDMARQLGVLPPVGSGMDRAMAQVQHLQALFQRRRA